jgi:hypothetical protein
MTDTILKPILLKYTLLLLVGQLILWWIFFLSPFNIPETIPFTSLKIRGLMLIALLVTIVISALKKFLKTRPEITIIKLTLLGTIICFVSEIIFQMVRQLTPIAETFNDRIYYFLLGVIAITTFGAVVSFLSSFQLKEKKTGQLIIMIAGLLLIVTLIKYITPTLIGN